MSYQLYKKGTDILVLVNEDCTGRKIARFKCNADDSKEVAKVFQAVIDKYGLPLKIVKSDKKDPLDWLKADEEFRF